MWLQKHLWAIVSTFLAALYVSLQLLQWKKHGDDFMMVAVSITATVALWLFLLWTIGRYWRDGRQSTSLRIQINEKDKLCEKLNDQLLKSQAETREAKRAIEEAERHEREKMVSLETEIPRAVRLHWLSSDVASLGETLQSMLNVAMAHGEPPDALQFPLSDRVYQIEIKQWAGFPVDVWRFRKDFESQRDKLRALSSLAPNLKAAFAQPSMTLPSDRTCQDVIDLLRQCAEELKQTGNDIWTKARSN